MLSVSTGHHWRYLTDQVAKGRENYYTKATEAGEPPGLWQGRGAEKLGLRGEVTAEAMEALYGNFVDPRDPRFADKSQWENAEKLGRAPRKFVSAEELYEQKLRENPGASPEERERMRAQAELQTRNAVAFVDATFSVQKSVSILHTAFRAQEAEATRAGDEVAAAMWAGRAESVERAIWAGNNAALRYIGEHAGYSRVGYHGKDVTGRWIDAHDLVVASFFQHTNRDGDMQLHIHNAILNRVEGADGVWRTLDSRAVHKVRGAAGALGERVMEEQMTAELGIEFRWRPDGKAREAVGVPSAARDLFSARRRAVTARVGEMAAAFEQAMGRAPNALELARISADAAKQTRARKSNTFETDEQRVQRLANKLRADVDTTMATIAEDVLGRVVDPAAEAAPFDPDTVIARAVAKLEEQRPTWTRYDLQRAISDELPDCLGGLTASQVRGLLGELVERTITPTAERVGTDQEVIRLDAPELIEAPAELRRADGRSQYEAPVGGTYATRGALAQEEHLQRAAQQEIGAPALSAEQADAALDVVNAQLAEEGKQLGADQAAALRGILTSGRPVEVLIGPAGTGKSFTLGTLNDLWKDKELWGQDLPQHVVGLAVSQQAAQVLQDEGVDVAANTYQWLEAQKRLAAGKPLAGDLRLTLRPGALVIVDESSMADRQLLVEVQRRVQSVGGKLLATGDHRQLGAVGAGGGLQLMTEAGQVYELREVRRFRENWERDASLRLREGDVDALAVYQRHGRLVDGGSWEESAQLGARSWLADTLSGRRSLLIVDTNEQAAELSIQLRTELINLGLVHDEGSVPLRDDGARAGVGDVIQARRNDWSWRRILGKAVVNRELYRVTGTEEDGSLRVRQLGARAADGTQQLGQEITLRPSYVREHVTLGYAVTVHAAQGATVDTAVGIYSSATSLEALYVALTRARERNVGIAVTRASDDTPPEQRVSDHAVVRPEEVDLTSSQIASDIMDRARPDRSALQTERDSLLSAISLRTLAHRHAEITDMANASRYAGMANQLVEDGELPADARDRMLAGGGELDALWRLLRAAELAGHDPQRVLAAAAGSRSLADADSVAKVLHHRIANRLTGQLTPAGDTFTDRTPEAPGDLGRYLRASAQAMDARRVELGEQVAETQPEWAVRRLGAVPEDVVERAEWTHRAGIVAAYREAAGHEDERDAIGPAPKTGQVEQRAAWHAAWRAFGAPEVERETAGFTREQLHERIEAYRRAQDWAPPWVGDELRATAEAARTYRQTAELNSAQARAAGDDPEAAEASSTAGAYAAMADQLEEQYRRLVEVDDARAAWYLETAPEREAADLAARELELRDATEVEPATRATNLVGVDRGPVLDQLVEQGTLTDRQRELLDADEAAPALWRLVDAAERDGHDVQQLLTDVVEQRDLGDAESIAAVLHYRIKHTVEQREPENAQATAEAERQPEQVEATAEAERQPEQVEATAEAERQPEQVEATAEAERRPVVSWPEGVPTLDETVEAAQRAREALATIEARQAEREARQAQELADNEAREQALQDEQSREQERDQERELGDEEPSLGL